VYKAADTTGEKLERSLDRLIEKRKKIVTSSEFLKATGIFKDYFKSVQRIESMLTITAELLSGYEL
jgi:hypothetical protein